VSIHLLVSGLEFALLSQGPIVLFPNSLLYISTILFFRRNLGNDRLLAASFLMVIFCETLIPRGDLASSQAYGLSSSLETVDLR
jgi:hypothetical protein